MPSKENQTNSPTDTTSAPDAAPRWSLEEWLSGNLAFDTTTVKCSECKIPTLHQWIKVAPTPLFQTNDIIEIVAKSKRLIVCTQCGLVKTIT